MFADRAVFKHKGNSYPFYTFCQTKNKGTLWYYCQISYSGSLKYCSACYSCLVCMISPSFLLGAGWKWYLREFTHHCKVRLTEINTAAKFKIERVVSLLSYLWFGGMIKYLMGNWSLLYVSGNKIINIKGKNKKIKQRKKLHPAATPAPWPWEEEQEAGLRRVRQLEGAGGSQNSRPRCTHRAAGRQTTRKCHHPGRCDKCVCLGEFSPSLMLSSN